MKNHFAILLIIVIGLFYSCKNERQFDNDAELCQILSDMITDDQRIRKMELFENGTKSQKDSLWEIQNRIDIKNTELLIEITEKRGWVSKKELGCNGDMAPVVIFRHSPKEYFADIQKLIEKESQAGRMTAGDYMFIDNHLKGRPAFEFQVVE